MRRRERAPGPPASWQRSVCVEGASKPEVGGREGVPLAEPQSERVRGPWPEPVDRGQGADQLLEAEAAVEPDLVLGDGACEGADRALPGAWQPEAFEVGVGERGRRREGVREAERAQSLDRRAEPLDEPARDRAGRRDGHLLSEDDAHARLERIPRSRRAQTRPRAEQRPDDRVAGELRRGFVEFEIEVRDSAGAGDEMDEPFPVREVDDEQEVVVDTRRELEDSRVACHDDRPAVGLARDVLDPGNRPRRQVGDEAVPVERPAVRQPQRKTAVRDEPVRLAPAGPQPERCVAEDLLTGAVELAHAPEAGRERDLEHREVGVVEEPPREVRPRRPGEAVGGHAELRREEAAQVARRHAEAPAELFLGRVVERAVEDHPHGAAHQLRPAPGHALRPAVRPALQAGPVAGGLGGSGKGEPPHVLGSEVARRIRAGSRYRW